MPRHVRPLDNRLLPPLHLDWGHPVPQLLESAAAQLTSGGVVLAMRVEVDGRDGSAVIPILCEVGDERWVPYIEPEAWDDAVVGRFVDWLSIVRASSHGEVNLQHFSRYPVPDIVVALSRNTGMARLQLEAHVTTVPHAFAANAQRLQRLMRDHLDVDLPLERASVETLDAVIDDHLGAAGPLVATQALVHLVGCFLGEVLVARHGGSWEAEGASWRVAPHGVEPLEAAVLRFARGERAPLVVHLPR